MFSIPLGRLYTQEKWKSKVMQNFGGQIRCIMGNVEAAYAAPSLLIDFLCK